MSELQYALECDSKDILKHFQDEFLFPLHEDDTNPSKVIYLAGNSLGLQPKGLQKLILAQLDKWSKQGVEGHFTEPTPWLSIDDIVKESMALVVGAQPDEVVMMNTLTSNIHFMMSAMYKPTAERYKILIEKKAFPSDIYAMKSQLQHHGYSHEIGLIELGPREGEDIIRLEDIESMIEKEGYSIAIVHFSGIQYYTGQFFNMSRITDIAHRHGCIVGFDLAHAVGNIPMQLHDWNIDFATWCSYKYLNCGPGSIGGCFLHNRHTTASATNTINPPSSLPSTTSSTAMTSAALPQPLPRLAGWWGHRQSDRFDMSGDFIAETGVNGFRVSNPSVLLIACVRASLDLFDKAGMSNLREKSIRLTGYLEHLLLTDTLLSQEVRIFTPSDSTQRGCQLSLTFLSVNIDHIYHELKLVGVICDVRKPNVMRVAPTPLYNSYMDVYVFIQKLKEVIGKISSSSSA